MHFSSFFVFAIYAVSVARCAPALDATTLANNAKQAQQLNAKFVTLKATDPCQGVTLNSDSSLQYSYNITRSRDRLSEW
jgi:hypothetical protein